MSNIGKQPVQLIEGVSLRIDGQKVIVNGPKGELETKIIRGINVEVKDNMIVVTKKYESHDLKKFHGLMRALIANMVKGVSVGFEKKLVLSGVGYRAKMEGKDLVLNVGFANAVKLVPIEGSSITVADNSITVSGIDKQTVGDMADSIRKIRVPDPYKGKGIKYDGEKLRKKVGKAAKAVGAGA
ncbi:MAG: 50S ribosomal protein L6 [Candidatus Levybacteria bacterium CG10_big_fil_rev_8_21_14_0_10_36_7]|nr:MAG: 50S ribosomal protein L6 [Candidatus Levybacteria bacterium CG10_big_fil_rev_8_21_14_0_10_36_7]